MSFSGWSSSGRSSRPVPRATAPTTTCWTGRGNIRPAPRSALPAWCSSDAVAAGATDLVATHFSFAFEHQVVTLRTLLVARTERGFYLTRQLCLALIAQEHERLLHGMETGRIMRSAEGGYSEIHAPLSDDRARIPPSRRDHDGPDRLSRVRPTGRGRVARRAGEHGRAGRARPGSCVTVTGSSCRSRPGVPPRCSQVRGPRTPAAPTSRR